LRTSPAWLILILFFLLVVASVPSSHAELITSHVVINEFEQNPPGDERYTGGEFAELFNPTGSSVDLSGWTLSTVHGELCSYTVLSGTVMGKGPSWWVAAFPGQCIDNYDPDGLVLRDKSGREVDRTPTETDAYSDARDWQRVPDSGSNWEFTSATKGYNNAPNPVPEFFSPVLVMLVLSIALTVLRVRRTRKLA